MDIELKAAKLIIDGEELVLPEGLEVNLTDNNLMVESLTGVNGQYCVVLVKPGMGKTLTIEDIAQAKNQSHMLIPGVTSRETNAFHETLVKERDEELAAFVKEYVPVVMKTLNMFSYSVRPETNRNMKLWAHKWLSENWIKIITQKEDRTVTEYITRSVRALGEDGNSFSV